MSILRTGSEAGDALKDELRDVDNPTGAARALQCIGARFWPTATTSSWQAYRYVAEVELKQWLKDPKPTVWAILDACERAATAGSKNGVGTSNISPQSDDSAPRYTCVRDSELDSLPELEPVLDPMLYFDSTSALVGPPGCGKSLLALDWALCVADGRLWIGHQTWQGTVAYVYAEGRHGIRQRVEAWKEFNAVPFDKNLGVSFFPMPVPLMDGGEVRQFIRDLKIQLDSPPVLIVVDTLARCMTGGDENTTKDMGLFVAGMDTIRRETGAHVQAVHHMNANAERERGNTALRGAVDTMMFLKRENTSGVIRLTCEKQKDAPEFDEVPLTMNPVGKSVVMVCQIGVGRRWGKTAIPSGRLAAMSARDFGGRVGVNVSMVADVGDEGSHLLPIT